MKWLPCLPDETDCYILIDGDDKRVMEVSRERSTQTDWTIWDWIRADAPHNIGLISSAELYQAMADPDAFYMERIL